MFAELLGKVWKHRWQHSVVPVLRAQAFWHQVKVTKVLCVLLPADAFSLQGFGWSSALATGLSKSHFSRACSLSCTAAKVNSSVRKTALAHLLVGVGSMNCHVTVAHVAHDLAALLCPFQLEPVSLVDRKVGGLRKAGGHHISVALLEAMIRGPRLQSCRHRFLITQLKKGGKVAGS